MDEQPTGRTTRRALLSRRALLGVTGAAALGLAGCSGLETDERTTESADSGGSGATADAKVPSATTGRAVSYTYQRPTGNRVVSGEGALPDATSLDVRVDFTPAWVVGHADDVDSSTSSASSTDAPGSTWAVVGTDGEVTGFSISDGTASATEITVSDLSAGPTSESRGGRPAELHGGQPPALYSRGGDRDDREDRQPALVTLADSVDDAARATHPVAVSAGLLYISEGGDLVLWNRGERDETDSGERDGTDSGEGHETDGGEADRLELDALRDARIVTSEGRAYVFAEATGRYDHAVLGDGVEAGSVAVVDYRDGLSEVGRIRPNPADSAVFEGIAPIVADLTGDGEREVVVTESDGERGARVVAFDADSERLATGPAIGHGYGWRHQLAVAPFAPDGRAEIAAVRTPHVGQTAEFYRLADGELEIVGNVSGYSSHTMGSRNLDGGLAGDLDGDGRVELLVPTADRRALGAVRRTDSGAEGVWEVGLGGALTTNLGAVEADGRVIVAAGWDSAVRFWSGTED